jgi:biotin-[acetyl-CoA-carboxylase] ligase BirA-like protein
MTEVLTEDSRINPSEVRECLHTRILGQAALYFRTLTSTNDIAKQLAMRGTKEGTIVLAENQSNGKGRLGRKWVSPEGGLWFSVIFRPKVKPKHALKLTLLGSVAVVKTVNTLYGLRAEIKWPNDVLINQKKVCGILTESEIKGKNLNFAVLGFGINANLDLNAFPQHLRSSATTLKTQLRKEISREILLCRLLENVEACCDLFRNRKFETILDDWRRLSGFLGSYVEILDNQQKIEGRALDLDADGALIVRLKDQNIHKVISGDVARIVQAKRPEHNGK